MAILENDLARGRPVGPEIVGSNPVVYVEYMVEPGLYLDGAVQGVHHQGMSLHKMVLNRQETDLAQSAPAEVYAFRIYEKTEGVMKDHDKNKKFSTEPEYVQGTAYIDGEVITMGEALIRAGKHGRDLAERMRKQGWGGRVIQTRSTGGWKTRFKPCGPADRIVSSKPPANGSR